MPDCQSAIPTLKLAGIAVATSIATPTLYLLQPQSQGHTRAHVLLLYRAVTGLVRYPVADSWTIGPAMNQQRSFPSGSHVGNTAVAVGGYDGVGTIASVKINAGSGGCGS